MTPHRFFVRKAMGLELEISLDELHNIVEDASNFGVAQIYQCPHLAYNQKNKPQEADIEVDGESLGTDWDEPAADWINAKKAALRKISCVLNESENLPTIGNTVERIVRQLGLVDIYFEDGSFVSAKVLEKAPGINTKPTTGCGCQKEASASISMVAAVHKGELLGAMDERKNKAKDPKFWSFKIDGPFELYLLKKVPMEIAEHLTDFPSRASRFKNPKHAWTEARKFSIGNPFKKIIN